MNLGLLLAYCRHIRRHIGVTSNIPGICRGFSFAVIAALRVGLIAGLITGRLDSWLDRWLGSLVIQYPGGSIADLISEWLDGFLAG